MHGKGLYVWPDGSSVDGEWVRGNVEGNGTFTSSNGESWIETWKNGKRLYEQK